MRFFDIPITFPLVVRHYLSTLYAPLRPRILDAKPIPLHDHDFAEVAWIDEGDSLVHQINGEEEEIGLGSLIFIRPSDAHCYHQTSERPPFLVNIAFQWHLYEGLKQRYFPGCNLYGEELGQPKVVQLNQPQLQSLRNGFLALLKTPVTEFYIERFLMNLLAEVSPPPAKDGPQLSSAPRWMRSAWQTIQRPEHLRIGVSEFYRLCGRCPEHVSREFHKQTGTTLVQSIAKLRMIHAAALLTGTTQEIIAISEECGFESLSHFYSCFRKEHGIPPLSYRKKAQGRATPSIG